MEAAKTFERNGVRYRPGDALPDDLDAPTKAHYRRYGMVRASRTPAPAENKPAAPARRQRTPGPKPAETPAPAQTAQTPASDAQCAADFESAQGEGAAQETGQSLASADLLTHGADVTGDATGSQEE